MEILIDEDAFSTTEYYSGALIKDVGDENKYIEKRFEFTISYTESDNLEDVVDITWIDEVPEDSEFLEKEILKRF